MDVYTYLYEVSAKNAAKYDEKLPFSLDVARSRVNKSPKVILDSEFDDLDDRDIRDAISLRTINHFPNLSIMSAYDRLMERYGALDRRLRIRSFLYFMSHHPTSKKNSWRIKRDESLSDFYKENAAFLQRIDSITAFAAVSLNISSEFRFFIHKKIVEPIWDSLGKENKNRIRRLFGREAK